MAYITLGLIAFILLCFVCFAVFCCLVFLCFFNCSFTTLTLTRFIFIIRLNGECMQGSKPGQVTLVIPQKTQCVRSASGIRTCKYILSTSAMMAYLNCQNLSSTWTRLFVKFGPCIHSPFKLTPLYLAEQSKTGLSLPGLNTGWCGIYHTEPSLRLNSSSGTRSA